MELRPYQQEALDTILAAMRDERFILAQAATGAGKTILFSSLIKRCMEQYQMRIGILAHREILVRQAYDKLLKVWPDGWGKIGLACSSVSHSVELRRPVVIGSPQTLTSRINDMPPLDLVIIDECHRVPAKNEVSQYRTLLETLQAYYPKLRVLGVTATPYRLGHGYIYGTECKRGKKNWWDKLHCEISISELQAQGYLVPCHGFASDELEDELGGVSTSNGEYNQGQLSGVMEKAVHIESAVHAYQQHGEGRQHVVAFCVTIRHAEKLMAAFEDVGISAGVVHSQMPKLERQAALEAFEAGKTRVICNVGVLTEGWDCTCVDCILFCRPTMSPALYVQMVGRGLRLHPGKTDCLLLDLSGNCQRHGDFDHPKVSFKGSNKAEKDSIFVRCPECSALCMTETGKKVRRITCQECHAELNVCTLCEQAYPLEATNCEECGTAFYKSCPACEANHVPFDARECPTCGHVFETVRLVEKGEVELRKIDFWRAQDGDTFPARVNSWALEPYTSQKGHMMARLSMNASIESATFPMLVCQYLDFEGNASVYGMGRARSDWRLLANSEPPKTVAEAVARKGELSVPSEITIKKNGRYYNVCKWSA